MNPAINLVCTRCVDGDHAALQRWYNDHLHLLLRAPELRLATLYRRVGEAAGAPDYFCVYDFDSRAAFLAFEHGEAMAESRVATQAARGWGSIEIVQRTQYQRWLRRQWAAPQVPAGQAPVFLAASLTAEPAAGALPQREQLVRWMNDRLHTTAPGWPLRAASMYLGAEGREVFVLLECAAAPADEGDGGLARLWTEGDAAYGPAGATLTPRWTGRYGLLTSASR